MIEKYFQDFFSKNFKQKLTERHLLNKFESQRTEMNETKVRRLK